MRSLFTLLIFAMAIGQVHANYVAGHVSDTAGNPLPYGNVYVKNTTYGASTNLKGYYFLELKEGSHTIVYSYLGFQTQELEVVISNGKPVIKNVILHENPYDLKSFSVIATEKDRAGEIMSHVRGRRKFYLDQVEGYSCSTYLKTSIEKELVKLRASDTLDSGDTLGNGNIDPDSYMKKQNLNLIETYSETYYRAPSTFRSDVTARNDYSAKRVSIEKSTSVSIGIEYGEVDIAPIPTYSANPYLIYQDVSQCDFNFYDNLISFPALCQKPLLSPIASGSSLSYRYRILETFVEDERTIYKIEVKPIFKEEALFEGVIYVEDSTWVLRSVDLSINPASLLYCREFRIIQNYEQVHSSVFLPVRREFIYSIRDGRYQILGNTRVNHSNYAVNTGFHPKFFSNEIIRYKDDAFDKDSVYWMERRPIVLQENELAFIRRSDSIQDYFVSDEYYRRLDSSFNRINKYWFWLTGVGHRNRARGIEYYIGGIPEQINPLGIGGYRHRLPGYFIKDFKNGYTLETRGFIDYGFGNHDVKEKINVGLTYLPLKFVRTSVEFGDFYEKINDFASLEQVFSRSNYVRTRSFTLAQRMEIVNGLFGELSFTYSDQDPISNLQLSKWSEIVFDDLNKPTEFIRYTKTELKLELKYRFKQKYIIKQGRKLVIGSDYPVMRLIYRKGIPGLFNSEVNFDYVELGIHHDLGVGRFGTSNWDVQMGSFLNKKNLRILEYKYFRGSDDFYFSDPTLSFQLLGPVLSTPNEFLRANYIHHFEGTILNKVPLVNKLHFGLAAGAGTLLIPQSEFQHFEMFAGLERVFRIKKQLFRIGVYAVTAENSIDAGNFRLKFGIDYFNSYNNKWSY